MLTFATTQRIYLARAVVDMRKSFDSLTSLVRNQLGKDPFTCDAFVFVGEGRNRVKILVWDVSGFWVCAKRLEKGAFALPKPAMAKDATSSLPLSVAEVHLLLEGIDVHASTYKRHYHRPDAVSGGDGTNKASVQIFPTEEMTVAVKFPSSSWIPSPASLSWERRRATCSRRSRRRMRRSPT